ncbi:MAG: aminotransferase class V-fold PLP-dependent enzyme [Ferrovibrio sp.]|uniref:aminotransferase class V-fold PLP-dependent enzyme n=1 Tax=Ferrovibrio sp. TaxID=1917215 RepID=UPI0026369CF5|nr:aminotransferase class V-fold PLP-dependent enzyme [Ferrovibrio sp.]MCW0232042.1 aminotransferase class V-fold PLP-dependent enzyme [Ferrovibrio sp.]
MTQLDLKQHFSRFLGSDPCSDSKGGRLHFAAHSHSCWPDASRAGQLLAWDDAARLIDGKWEHVLGSVLPQAQGHVARLLNLPDPQSVVFAPNTHELVKRLLSCFPADKPIRLLTSDSEFHSFARQIARMEEEGLVQVTRIPSAPYESFAARFAAAARAGFDLIFVSQVFFNSGFAVEEIGAIAAAAGEAMLVIDGYHAFMARPVDWSAFAARAFYLAGGYKYAMAGEGACFMHCPPGWGARPRDTGWYAAFGALSGAQDNRTAYAESGWRFMGATFDPSGLYRFNAVQDWLVAQGIGVATIHDHVRSLQKRFIAALPAGPLQAAQLVVPDSLPHGNFLTFELPDAEAVQQRLMRARVVTDHRGSRLRIGFGLYHTADDVEALLGRLQDL